MRLVLQGGSLRVMYENFPEETDKWYDPGTAELASPRDVAALRARFRLVSPPLEDARCGDLRPGQQLCVFCVISDLDRKYHDAVLHSVRPSPRAAPYLRFVAHTFDYKRRPNVQVKRAPHDGEERC